MNNKAIIAMSGGVDSSVAAFLMKEKGFSLTGVTLSLYSESPQDIADAENVAHGLGFGHITLNYKSEFEKEVIGRFTDAYEHTRTPNPCVDCNKYIKFGLLGDYAAENGYEYLATGHYARVERENGRFLLKKGVDLSKDQSYVLYSLKQEQLKHIIFPLGDLSKQEAREIADENGFVNAHKRESQDICFVENGKYAEFIENYLGKTYPDGDFVDFDGNILGTHKGLIRYTIGQRKGLGLALPKPMYVCRLCPEQNCVMLGDDADLFTNVLDAYDVNLIATDKLSGAVRAEVKVRYAHKPQKATVWQMSENEIHVEFDEPQRAITGGQAVVLYDGDTVIGGGTIR